MALISESPGEFYRRFKKGVFPADSLVVIFAFTLLLIGILNYGRIGNPYNWVSTDFGVVVLLILLIYKENQAPRRFYTLLHFLWPVISMAFFYTQCTTWDNLIFSHTFDHLLLNWERVIFGTELHRLMAPAVNSLWIDELMHAFYFSYYLILFLPALWMLRHQKPRAFEMIFSLTLMLYVHFLFFMVFPGDGPINERGNLFSHGVIFIPLMDFIYQIGGQAGGGAFPSTHVSSAILIFVYIYKYAPGLRIPIGVLCGGIILATVYCSYHYAIDSVAGIVTGTLFFFIGQYVYARWRLPSLVPSPVYQQNS